MTTENTTTSTPSAPMTNKELFDKLVPIYTEIALLEEDAKALKEEADESDLKFSAVAALAKAKARDKLGTVESKAQDTLDLIEELQG